MNIYVSNISFKASDEDLKELFSEYGDVVSARIITDKMSNRSKGFGFVEIENDSNAQQAIDSLDGIDFMGRNIVVNEAKPRPEGDRR